MTTVREHAPGTVTVRDGAPAARPPGHSRAWLRALELTAPIPRTPRRILPTVIEELAERVADAPALLSDGESLTYLISWGPLRAAQGVFVARRKDGHWEFHLDLGSRGMVEEYYPFRGYFWSILAPGPWRSTEYGEYRFEPRRTIKERTRIDYAAHLGTREIWVEGKTNTFPTLPPPCRWIRASPNRFASSSMNSPSRSNLRKLCWSIAILISNASSSGASNPAKANA